MSDRLFSEAAEAYGNAVSAGGPADTLGLAQSRALLLGADYEGARRVLMRLLKDVPDNDEARYWVVHSYVREGRADKAQGFLVRDSDRKTGWQYLAEAEVQEAEGKDQHAFVAFGVASRLLPNEGHPQAGLGRLSAKQKNFSSAIIYFGKAMANEPYNSEYVLDMGRSYEAIDEHASALAVYEEALKESPKDVEIHYLIANVLRKQREYPQAVGAVKKGLKQDPKNAKLHYLLGDIQRLRGKSKDAISAYEIAAKEGGKEFFDAYRQIGLLYYHKLVDNNSAEKYFKKYIRAGGQDKEVDELIKKLTTK
jgi:tetratricopeptide (TPR) repeat protein